MVVEFVADPGCARDLSTGSRREYLQPYFNEGRPPLPLTKAPLFPGLSEFHQ